jgi:hypothetical protein
MRVAPGAAAAYSAPIERQTSPTQEPDMNPKPTQKLTSLALALVLTLGMLFGVDGLASSPPAPSDLAQFMLAPRA